MDTKRVQRIMCRRWTERAEYVEEREQREEVRWDEGTVEKTENGIG